MKHSILGAGGVGGFIGAVLAKAGEPVTLVVRPGTERSYPSTLSLDSSFGKIVAPVQIATRAAEFDVLWVTVKATQLDAAKKEIDLPAGSVIVPLLNGLDHVAALRKRFGHDAVIPATIAIESERTAPGQIAHRSPFARLKVAASGEKTLAKPIEQLRAFGVDCQFVQDETTLMWTKLALLAPIALSTTAARAPIGAVRDDPDRAKLLYDCVREACAVGAAEGAKLDAESLIGMIKSVVPTMRSSMQKDLEAGNPLELDAIGETILRRAAAKGVATPSTKTLVERVRSLSRPGERHAS